MLYMRVVVVRFVVTNRDIQRPRWTGLCSSGRVVSTICSPRDSQLRRFFPTRGKANLNHKAEF